MKRIYKHPEIKSIHLDFNEILTSSGFSQQGTTEDKPAQLKRLLPLFVKYEDLESDIQMNLQNSNYAINYRKIQMYDCRNR